jgi:tRNA A37 threonylcarbamoyladenosine synthetase subunit TsaC/SUA5/YrdC
MELWDPNLVQQIIRFKRSALDKALGLYVVSGEQIYMLQQLEENVMFQVCL